MKTILLNRFLQINLRGLLSVMIFFLVSSCYDNCKRTHTYTTYEPVFMKIESLRNAVKSEPARNLKALGKMYFWGNYIFVNEIEEGVHIIDNTDPTKPQNISFIAIPGNVDIAVRDNILYADSYIDLVAFDISDPTDVKILKRIQDVFPYNYKYGVFEDSIIVDWVKAQITEEIKVDCQEEDVYLAYDYVLYAGSKTPLASSPITPPTGNNGKGGSLARFAIYDNYLYTVDFSTMRLFDISTPSNPVKGNEIKMGWGIETIFPYQDKLFLGSQTGMHIYNNVNPSSPTFLSMFAHVRTCDPVVVEGDYAYVTLRGGSECGGFTNQLDVIDIKDLSNPTLIKSYPMKSPRGLGIDNATLFICEGEFGMKVYDATDPLKIDVNLLKNFTNIKANDVIPLGNVLLVIGDDGLYQYDYSDPKNLKLLSVIPII